MGCKSLDAYCEKLWLNLSNCFGDNKFASYKVVSERLHIESGRSRGQCGEKSEYLSNLVVCEFQPISYLLNCSGPTEMESGKRHPAASTLTITAVKKWTGMS